MRVAPFIISTVVTSALIFALNKQWGSIPPMGKFLHPQYGFWQNAEPAAQSFDADPVSYTHLTLPTSDLV